MKKSASNTIIPKKPIAEIMKQLADDKAFINRKIKEGKKHELKERFAFAKPL